MHWFGEQFLPTPTEGVYTTLLILLAPYRGGVWVDMGLGEE